MEPEGMTLAKLQKGVALMLKIKEQCQRWGFTKEVIVNTQSSPRR
jgi:hypothetical protein